MSIWVDIAKIVGSTIFGMIIKQPFDVLFKELKRKFRIIRLKIWQPKEWEASEQNFIFCRRTTSVFIVDGDGVRSFQPENLRIEVVSAKHDFGDMSKEVDYFYNQTVRNIEERQNKGETVPWNGDTLSLYKYEISRTQVNEEYSLYIELLMNKYYNTYSVIHHLNDVCPETNKCLKEYIDNFSFEQSGTYQLPNSIGICLQVFTKDDYTIFSKRSIHSGFRPGESDVSIVEGLNADDIVNHQIDIKQAATRAFLEEICEANGKEIDIQLLSMIFDKNWNQWNIVGCVYADLTRETILERHNSGSSGKWEISRMDFVPAELKDIFVYISSHRMWDTGLTTLYLSLCNYGYSRKKLNKALDKYYAS